MTDSNSNFTFKFLFYFPEYLLDNRLNELFLLLKHPLIKTLKDQRLNIKLESLKVTDLET
jgi:hypothetical protein